MYDRLNPKNICDRLKLWWKSFKFCMSKSHDTIFWLQKQECIPVGCVPPAHWPYLIEKTMHAPQKTTHTPLENHAHPPGATTHAPRSNHACSLGATMHAPPEQPCTPPRATMHAPQATTYPPGATMHAPLEQPRMPPRATMHAPRSNHAPPWEQPCMPPQSNHTCLPCGQNDRHL